MRENVGSITVTGYDGIYEKRPPTFIFRRGTSFNVDPGIRTWACKSNCDNIAVDFVGWRNLNGGNPLDAGQRISFVILDDDNDGRRTKFFIDNEEVQVLPQDNMWQEVTVTMSRRGVPRIYTEDSIGIIAETILPASEPNRCGEGTLHWSLYQQGNRQLCHKLIHPVFLRVQANNQAWVRIKVQGRSQTVTQRQCWATRIFRRRYYAHYGTVTGSMSERFKRNSNEADPTTTQIQTLPKSPSTLLFKGSQNNDLPWLRRLSVLYSLSLRQRRTC
ncbi:MAG: hypothetical protein KatS3mg087_0272 [Patescibacteria group bacterium]|nr:MAG: hypothetical protein KatS3mg087_0272 [Patescibacteria group bacterium]